ncbi:MAG: type II toxin-antitoxin system PemK/MazF family toxin [Acidobacteria bacterium]|jgi:mRNA interferase MazF|nr:type II toxin-antitoxin system PemK/MazF family toxin [Acidobacteriota bacterium]MBA4122950.1 type II toxin-antitoxin system PemK/MazF family toxin [Acidobacteriota bacterium]MBA4183147.1 type II toxin-antitoxin system PemK/MazF family toxin [Acidobacteriota bacterium]
MTKASRGEIWLVNLSPTEGREQAGTRPALIVSVDIFNHGAAELVVVIPVTSKTKGIPLHVEINPPEGGLSLKSFVKCEDVRSISTARLIKKLGKVSPPTVNAVEDRLKILLGL